MMKNVRWRLALTALVIGLSCLGLLPARQEDQPRTRSEGRRPPRARVQTDDALRSETEITVERLRDTLTRNGVAFTSST